MDRRDQHFSRDLNVQPSCVTKHQRDGRGSHPLSNLRRRFQWCRAVQDVAACRQAVVQRAGVWMVRRHSIFHAVAGDAMPVGLHPRPFVAGIASAKDQGAAVQVDHRAAWMSRRFRVGHVDDRIGNGNRLDMAAQRVRECPRGLIVLCADSSLHRVPRHVLVRRGHLAERFRGTPSSRTRRSRATLTSRLIEIGSGTLRPGTATPPGYCRSRSDPVDG